MKYIICLLFILPQWVCAQGEMPLGDSPTRVEINAFLTANPQVNSVESFVKDALPRVYKERAVLMFTSGAFTGSFTSFDSPRAISFGADGRTVFAWTTHDHPFRKDIVEVMTKEGDQWFFGDIDMSKEKPQVIANDSCGTCHGRGENAKPLWGMYPNWAGSEEPNVFAANRVERARLKEIEAAPHPRLAPLDINQISVGRFKRVVATDIDGVISEAKPAVELQVVLQNRHAEVIFEKLKARPDYQALAREISCSVRGTDILIREYPNEMAIQRFIFGVDFPEVSQNHGDYGGNNGSVARLALVLMFDDLYKNNLFIKNRFDSADVGVFRFGGRLATFPSNVGHTAADELKSQVARLTTLGKEGLRLRQIHPSRTNKSLVAAGLVIGLERLACAGFGDSDGAIVEMPETPLSPT